jgi:hypothetical protein
VWQDPVLVSFAKAVMPDNSEVVINSTVPDQEGNIYVAGYTENRALLATLNQNGELVWHKEGIGTGNSGLNDIAVYNGDLYVVGNYTGSLTFGGITITGTSSIENPYVARFNSQGDIVWIKTTLSGTSYGGWGSIAAGPEGIYCAGMFYHSRDLGNGVTIQSNSWAYFDSPWIVKYSHDGIPQWAITSSQNRCASVSDMALKNGLLAVVSYTNGSGNSPFAFGSLPALNGTGYNFNGYVAVFDAAAGTPKWNVLAPVGGSSDYSGVAIHDGFVYAVGFVDPSVYILYEDTNNKSMVTKFDAETGVVIWNTIGEPARSRYHKIQADNSGLYITGYQTADIRQGIFQKYDLNTGGRLETKKITGSQNSWFGNISLDSEAAYLTAIQSGTAAYSYDGINDSVQGSSTAENGIIIRYIK